MFSKNDIEKEHETKNSQEGGSSSDQASMESLYEASLKDIKEGQIVTGKIVGFTEKEVIIDVGYKSEGLVPVYEFSDPAAIQIGNEIEVFIESKENDEGMVVVSKQKADRLKGWENIVNNRKEGDVVKARVMKRVKGGMMVEVEGVECFLPASLSTLKNAVGTGHLMGQQIDVRILKINIPRKNIVVSRKDVLEEEKKKAKEGVLEKITKGSMAKGIVKNITDFGAFVDLGENTTGLLHITDMSWSRISHPSEMVAVGDEIEVMILDFNKDNMRISLGLKQKSPNPWLDIDSKYPSSKRVKGKVVNIVPYGAFVELEKGIEGLIHISEMSWTKKYANPNELLAIGDVVETVILTVDKQNHKIALGIKQLEQDPWLKVEEKYVEAAVVKGKVRNLTDYGAFIELEEGIDGLIHISDMSWTKRIAHPKDLLKKGQKIEAVVLFSDSKNRKISLGLKQLTANPWDELVNKYKTGAEYEVKVKNIAKDGVYFDIEEDLEGYVPATDTAAFKIDDLLKVKVVKAEPSQKRILCEVVA